jgi:hypothetical protein
MFYTLENHNSQMQSKDQPLQIYKWNSCSMLLKFLNIISHHLNIISIGFVQMTSFIASMGQHNFVIPHFATKN